MRSFVPDLVKILVFAVVTVLLTAVLGATIANTNFGETSGYTAKFTDASGLKEGDDVRIDVILIAPRCWPRHIENAWMGAR